MNKETLLKYLKNNCSSEEFEEVVRWATRNNQDNKSRNWGFEQWQSLNPLSKERDKKNYHILLHKIHHEINIRRNKEKYNKVKTLPKVTKWFKSVAAIFFIPLLLTVSYLLSTHNIKSDNYANLAVDSIEIIAPVGSRTVCQLSDGTEINLNYGSKIKYPHNFTGDTREIKLTGEGYFDVAHNPDKPFIVKTGKLNIKALGTEFNVQAYPDDSIVTTTLVSGEIVIEETFTDSATTLLGKMVPGQDVEYHIKTGEINSSIGSIDKHVAWKSGKMIFDNATISEVARRLSRKFNVNIIVEEDIKDYTYTVTFLDDPLFLILDLMKEMTPITYKKFPRKKLSDGSFTKQEIKILKKV
jgi:transmembrane sensor